MNTRPTNQAPLQLLYDQLLGIVDNNNPTELQYRITQINNNFAQRASFLNAFNHAHPQVLNRANDGFDRATQVIQILVNNGFYRLDTLREANLHIYTNLHAAIANDNLLDVQAMVSVMEPHRKLLILNVLNGDNQTLLDIAIIRNHYQQTNNQLVQNTRNNIMLILRNNGGTERNPNIPAVIPTRGPAHQNINDPDHPDLW